jgi:Ala-tRNA(Pro) deacylase
MSVPRWLTTMFDHYGVPYEEHHHPPVFSASHLAHAEHVTGFRVAKTVLLNACGRPVAFVLPACTQLDVAWAQAVLGSLDIHFASEDDIAHWFRGCELGAVPPVRLRGDEPIVMDRGMAHLGKILFAAGTTRDAVVVRFRDWYRMVRPGVGRFALPLRGPAVPKPPPPGLWVEDEEEMGALVYRA